MPDAIPSQEQQRQLVQIVPVENGYVVTYMHRGEPRTYVALTVKEAAQKAVAVLEG